MYIYIHMYIYRVFLTGRDGGSPLQPTENFLIPSRLPLPPKVNSPLHILAVVIAPVPFLF